ncbi:unnamed protein product [Alternaria alternata]
MKLPGAFKDLLADCEGVAHVASDLSFSPDPNVVITGCVNGIKAILEEAHSTPTIKRFVYTSSSNAATKPLVDEARHVNSSSWNDGILDEAWAPPPYHSERAYAVPLSVAGAGSTARWVRDAFDHPSEEEYVAKLRDDSPQWQVDVEDIAKLHLAALIFDEVNGERLFGFAFPFNYNSFLRVFRNLAPDHLLPADEPRKGKSEYHCGFPRDPLQLSRKFGANGWSAVSRKCSAYMFGYIWRRLR